MQLFVHKTYAHISGVAMLSAKPLLHVQFCPFKIRFYNPVLQDLHYVLFGPSHVKHLL